MKSIAVLAVLCLFVSGGVFAQAVAINASGASASASAILDVSSTTKGLLVPRMTLAQRGAIATPATGLEIYQTDGASGFWYYDGTVWTRMGNGNGTVTSVATTAPLTGGTITTTGTLGITQAGTASDGYLSSTDWNTFNSKVGGSGTATRVAFWNSASTLASDANLYWDNTNNRLGIGNSSPGFRLDVVSGGRSINSATSSATNSALIGFNTAAAGAGNGGNGLVGQTNQSASQALRCEQLNAGGFGIAAINLGAVGANGGGGIYAQTSQSNGFASDSRNLNASGTGVFGVGNNLTGLYLTAGSGGAFNGNVTGLYARSTTAGVGEGIYTDQFGIACRVNYWSGTQYKIIGTGTVSTTADGLNGDRVTLHCTEGPEILFEDYGQGKLVNGRTHIEIDPIIAKNIVVTEKHPLRVYIQLEGECNGVYVTNKTATSFDVVELANGQSNTPFQYHLIGNRADEVLPNGRISKNADLRFEPAPADRETKAANPVLMGEATPAPANQ